MLAADDVPEDTEAFQFGSTPNNQPGMPIFQAPSTHFLQTFIIIEDDDGKFNDNYKLMQSGISVILVHKMYINYCPLADLGCDKNSIKNVIIGILFNLNKCVHSAPAIGVRTIF